MPLDLSTLDNQQRLAVRAPDGPVLVLAGAGSGKTRTLTARIAWLIDQGTPADQIMAVTFTRKAAEEMRVRLRKLLGTDADGRANVARLRVGTFHALMAMALRRLEPELLAQVGRTSRFVVWDTDDTKAAFGQILSGAEDPRIRDWSKDRKSLIAQVSSWRNSEREIPPAPERPFDIEQVAAWIVPRYEQLKRRDDAVDFDDLLTIPVQLMTANPELRRHWSSNIAHLLVDEFQDTNLVQLRLVELLSSVHGNLFVVGDDAQSIYAFRGARIANITTFAAAHPGTTVVPLTVNYRSTPAILGLANRIIAESDELIQKQLRAAATTRPGPDPRLAIYFDEEEESAAIANLFQAYFDQGLPWRQMATLLRTHSQSRPLEAALFSAGIPYRLLGGQQFWGRAEVRDLLAWLRPLVNPRDGMAVARALGMPKRGIGEVMIAAVRAAATDNHGGNWIAGGREIADSKTGQVAGRAALGEFVRYFEEMTATAGLMTVPELVNEALTRSGLDDAYKGSESEITARRENLQQVVAAAAAGAQNTLGEFLESAALADSSGAGNSADGVVIATLHAAKGLEWPVVVLAAVEEGLLPHGNSMDDPAAIEEERRLVYVGITRAKQRLTLTAACRRRVGASWGDRELSRFIREALSGVDVPSEMDRLLRRVLNPGAFGSLQSGRPYIRPGTGSSRPGSYRPQRSTNPGQRRP